MDLAQLVDPAHTAVCVVECQNGVIGAQSSLPALAEAASTGLVPALVDLCAAARGAGVRVVHATAHAHPDGWGANRNARLFGVARKSPVQQLPGTPAVEPVPELGFDPATDVVVSRFHGLAPVAGTGLDPMLRNEGVTTVVVAGVSLNVAVPNAVFDLVNLGYQVVVPTDAVIATPAGYAEHMLANTLVYVATLTEVSALAGVWAGQPA